MAVVPAPSGWGWVPGTNLAEVEPGDLPELPLLPLIHAPRARMRVLREVAEHFPYGTRPQHLQQRYGVPYASAFDILHRAHRLGTARKATDEAPA